MSLEEIIYDILEIKSALEDDHDLEPMWLLQKVNNYREIFINQDYAENQEIKSQWLQRLAKQNVQKINSADDPAIELTSVTLGKVIIPEIMDLPYDLGLYRISGSAGILNLQSIDFNTLMLKIDAKEEIMGEYGYCSRIGKILYLYPYIMEMSGLIIPRNPFDMQVNDNGTLRAMVASDPYPVDSTIAQKIILEILTKDLAIWEKSISDITNDSNMQLRIMKDNVSKQRSAQE